MVVRNGALTNRRIHVLAVVLAAMLQIWVVDDFFPFSQYIFLSSIFIFEIRTEVN